MKKTPFITTLAAVVLTTAGQWAFGEVQTHTLTLTPGLDRWMYPFGSQPGAEQGGQTFGAIEDPDWSTSYSSLFDARDGQFLLGFNTSASLTPGLGASNYQVTSVKITVTNGGSAITYDPTYDSYKTYKIGTTAAPQADTDAGRPVELYGVGFRGGYNHLSYTAGTDAGGFKENTAFAPSIGPGKRYAYAMGFDENGVARDVSNNIQGGFESNPWAIGTINGDPTVFTLDLNLDDASIRQYVQSGLDAGSVAFMISSLHLAGAFGSGGSYPNFYTREGAAAFGAGFSPKIEITYVVPEPSSMAVLAIGSMALLARRRRKLGL